MKIGKWKIIAVPNNQVPVLVSLCLVFLAVFFFPEYSFPQAEPPSEQEHEITANEIFEKTIKQYDSLESFEVTGTQLLRFFDNDREVTGRIGFEIKLGKPNLYQIVWNKTMTGEKNERGAVWNTGFEAFIYISNLKSYFKTDNDIMTLVSAYGIRRGFVQYIPWIFFYGSNIFNTMTEVQLQGTQTVGGEPCYVIAGKSAMLEDYHFWISKNDFFIKKTEYSFDLGKTKYYQKLFNGVIKEEYLIKMMGLEADESKTEAMRRMVNFTKETIRKYQRGKVTEIYVHPKANAALLRSDFKYEVPAQTELRNSLYEYLFDNIDNLIKN